MTAFSLNTADPGAPPIGTTDQYEAPCSFDDTWYEDLLHHTGMADSVVLALDSHLARRIGALIEHELRLARAEYAAQGVDIERSPFGEGIRDLLEFCNPMTWTISADNTRRHDRV